MDLDLDFDLDSTWTYLDLDLDCDNRNVVESQGLSLFRVCVQVSEVEGSWQLFRDKL